MAIEEPRRLIPPPPVALPGVLSRGSLWGVGDQALISATNFLTLIIIARNLSPTDFGAFTLAYTAIQFANSLQAALVTQPHNVLGATRSGNEYVSYTVATAISQVFFTGIVAFLAAAGAVIAYLAGWSIAPLLLALILALVAWQLQEFARRVFYTEDRLALACTNDLVSYGAQAVVIFALGRAGKLTGTSALYTVAITSAVAAVWGFWEIRARLPRRAAEPRLLKTVIAENWRFGKWLFGAALAAWTSDQCYPVLVGGFVSVAATGSLRAVQTIMGPTNILLRAMSQSLTPRAARIYGAGGYRALRAFVRHIILLTAPFMLAYCLLIAIFARPILTVLYGDRYRQYDWLLALIALSYALIYTRTPAIIALEARGISRPVFQTYLWLTLMVFTAGIGAIYWLGLAGAALGLVATGVVSNGILWWWYHQMAETDRPDEPEGAQGDDSALLMEDAVPPL